MSTDRFAAFGDHLTASFNAQNIGGRVESAYRFATPVGGVTPFSALQAQSLPNTDLQRSRSHRRRFRSDLQWSAPGKLAKNRMGKVPTG
jgi:hypothetical protein